MLKTVLIVSPFFSPNIGGVETHLDDLILSLNEAGINSIVSTYMPLSRNVRIESKPEKRGQSVIYRAKWFGIGLFDKIEDKPIIVFPYLFIGLLLQTFWLTHINRNKFQTFHAHGVVAGAIVVILSKIYRKKSVISIHAFYEVVEKLFVKKVFKLIFNKIDVILTLSTQSKNQIISLGIAPNKIHKYTYWVNQEIFNIRSINLHKNKTNILFVGRFIEKKGTNLLLELVKLSDKDSYNFTLIGSGPEYEKIKSYEREFSNFNVLHNIPNEELPEYYKKADLLLIPSLYSEGMARVKMEAFSCGLPVIASDTPGLREDFDERYGMLVNPTVQEFYSAINELKMRNVNPIECRRFAVNTFSKKNAGLIINAY